MKTNTKISKQLERKTNPLLVETIMLSKKNSAWKEISSIISGPRKKMKNVNLADLDKMAEKEKIIVVPGKILSEGEFNKKTKVVALSFSDKAKEKLLKTGCEVSSILEEIKLNPKANGVKIIK
jgi:large subunit ribosomal protein L18e